MVARHLLLALLLCLAIVQGANWGPPPKQLCNRNKECFAFKSVDDEDYCPALSPNSFEEAKHGREVPPLKLDKEDEETRAEICGQWMVDCCRCREFKNDKEKSVSVQLNDPSLLQGDDITDSGLKEYCFPSDSYYAVKDQRTKKIDENKPLCERRWTNPFGDKKCPKSRARAMTDFTTASPFFFYRLESPMKHDDTYYQTFQDIYNWKDTETKKLDRHAGVGGRDYDWNWVHTTERQRVQDEILSEYLSNHGIKVTTSEKWNLVHYQPSKGTPPIVIFTVGPMAAGKSHTMKKVSTWGFRLRKVGDDEVRFLTVDPDEFKTLLRAKRKKLWTGIESIDEVAENTNLHLESAFLREMLLDWAIEQRINIVVDGSLSNPSYDVLAILQTHYAYRKQRNDKGEQMPMPIIGMMFVDANQESLSNANKLRSAREGRPLDFNEIWTSYYRFHPEDKFFKENSEAKKIADRILSWNGGSYTGSFEVYKDCILGEKCIVEGLKYPVDFVVSFMNHLELDEDNEPIPSDPQVNWFYTTSAEEEDPEDEPDQRFLKYVRDTLHFKLTKEAPLKEELQKKLGFDERVEGALDFLLNSRKPQVEEIEMVSLKKEKEDDLNSRKRKVEEIEMVSLKKEKEDDLNSLN